MAATPTTEMIKSDCKRKAGMGQVTLEARLKLEGNADIAKVLSVSADGIVNDCAAQSGAISYGGKVCFKAIILDTEGALRVPEYTVDFSGKLDAPGVTPGDRVTVCSAVVDTDTVSVDGDSMKVSAVVDLTAYANIAKEVTALTCAAEGIFTHTERICYGVLDATVTNDFIVEAEYEIPECKDEILSAESHICLTEARARLDNIVVNGCIYTNFIYCASDGRCKNTLMTAEFAREIAAQGVNGDSLAQICLSLQRQTVKIIGGEGDAKPVVRCEFAVSANGFAYGNKSQDVVTDAFSVSHELEICAKELEVCLPLACQKEVQTIDGTAGLDEDMPQIDQVLGVTGTTVQVANVYDSDGKVTVEGLVNCSVLYFSKEFETTHSVAVQLPFSKELNIDATGNCLSADACVTDISAKSRRGKEMDVAATLEITVHQQKTCTHNIVTEITVGAERALDLSAISIYVCKKDQTLWDVAKEMSTTPEILMVQNPNTTFPLKGGERIAVYRQMF